ncbi:hypothetical protein QUA54_10475 [Microcoleus sp. MOSTC5]|uniref:hypothetical protein n=1 Tax=Microcoleus sp. MOSTC5 TaxID=3055378 RepID=UPI002FD793E2
MVADESIGNKITRIVKRQQHLWEMRSAQQIRLAGLKPVLHKQSPPARTKEGILKSDLVTVNCQLTTVNCQLTPNF